MSMTLFELEEYIKHQVAEIDFLELLNITTEDLVEAFKDKIEENADKLIVDLELETN